VKRHDDGFTLLELLVALVVLGVLMAALAQGMWFGISVWGRQTRVAAARAGLDATDRTLRNLLEDLQPPNAADPPTLAGTASTFAFRGRLPAAAPFASREADIEILVDHDHNLVLRWLPAAHVVYLGLPPSPHTAMLLRGVEHIEFAYWPKSDQGTPGWRTRWTAHGAPALISFRVVFASGDPRHWPDIIVAPMRSPSGA
jgi:general secretion pathway protein J